MSTPPVEKLRLKGCCGDGHIASYSGGDDGAHGGPGVVMVDDVLGLRRADGGCGWRQGLWGRSGLRAGLAGFQHLQTGNWGVIEGQD